MSQQITVQNAGRFALAGDAVFTMLRPQRFVAGGDLDAERRFTYRIQRADPKGDDAADARRPWFVKVLNGPDNVRNYQYLGTIFPARRDDDPSGIVYRHGVKSKVSETAPSVKGIAWFVRNLDRLIVLRQELETADMFRKPHVEVEIDHVVSVLNKLSYYHEGRCGRCRRKLTVPESIINGIGPVCAAKGGLPGILQMLARI